MGLLYDSKPDSYMDSRVNLCSCAGMQSVAPVDIDRRKMPPRGITIPILELVASLQANRNVVSAMAAHCCF